MIGHATRHHTAVLCRILGHKPEPRMTTFQGRTPADDCCTMRMVCARCELELASEDGTPQIFAARILNG